MGGVNSLVKSPSGELYAGLYGGDYEKVRRYEEGVGWIPMNNGLSGTYVYDLAFKGEYLFAAINGGVWRYSSSEGWVVSINSHLTFNNLMVKDSAIFASISRWSGGSSNNGGIYRSLDNGNSWKIFNQRFNDPLWTRDFAFIDSIIFMTAEGDVYRSDDYGETWWIPYSDSVFEYDVIRLGVIGSRLFAHGGRTIYRSDDYGRTWDRIEGLLPGWTFLVHEKTLFVGGGSIFFSLDSGDTWYDWSEGISGVHSLLVHDGYLLAGTSIQVCDYSCGRVNGNVWRRPLSEIVSISPNSFVNKYEFGLKTVHGYQVGIEFTLPKSGWVELNLYTPNGKLAIKLVQGSFEKGVHFISLHKYNLPDGLYLARLEGLGLNFAQKVFLE